MKSTAQEPLQGLPLLSAYACIAVSLNLLALMLLVFKSFSPIAGTFALLGVAAAVPVFLGWRWGSVLCVLFALLGTVASLPFIGHELHAPGTLLFSLALARMILLAVALLTGLMAAVRTFRGLALSLPRWLVAGLIAVGGIFIGSVAVGQIAVSSSGAVSAVAEALQDEYPVLTMHEVKFVQPEIQAKVGETVILRVENLDAFPHSVDIDELNLHVPVGPGQSGVILFRPTRAGSFILYCEPHYNKKDQIGMSTRLIVTE